MEISPPPPKKLKREDRPESASCSGLNESEVLTPFVPSQHPFGPNTEEWHPAARYYELKLLQELYTKKQMPVINFSVFRCPKETPDLLSRLFYSGRLRSSKNSKERCEATEVLGLPTSYPTQFIFADGEEVANGSTFYNKKEAEFAWKLLIHLRSKLSKETSIAVITFYSSQVGYFNSMNREEGVANFVGTVDSSQGNEYDIVILLTTRTSQGFKFIEDPERVNVALSQARMLNLVIFNKKGFPTGAKSVWKKIDGQIPKRAKMESKDIKI